MPRSKNLSRLLSPHAVEMDHVSDESTDISDGEVNDFVDHCYLRLQNGDLRVKVSGGTYKCPFCVGKKKLVYQYNDLLQHASSVGASNYGKRKAQHQALAKLLRIDLSAIHAPSIQAEVIEQELPHLCESENQLVWPWKGIIANVKKDSATMLKQQLSKFHPLKVTPLWNSDNHIETAILDFGHDWAGFRNAVTFGNYFEAEHLGRRDWFKKEVHESQIYGWVASAEDYHQEDHVGDFLRRRGDLKSLVDLANQESRKKDKLIADLTQMIESKNELIRSLDLQKDEVRRTLDMIRLSPQSYNEEEFKSSKQEGGGSVACQICDMPNHTARYCLHRFDQTYEPEGMMQCLKTMTLSKNDDVA